MAFFDNPVQYLREQGAHGLTLSGGKSEGARIGSVAPSRRPPGRAMLTDRRIKPMQVRPAYQPPHADR
ncbi:hypothetical protein ACWC9U_34340 [Streptomyces sp. 900116325]